MQPGAARGGGGHQKNSKTPDSLNVIVPSSSAEKGLSLLTLNTGPSTIVVFVAAETARPVLS